MDIYLKTKFVLLKSQEPFFPQESESENLPGEMPPPLLPS